MIYAPPPTSVVPLTAACLVRAARLERVPLRALEGILAVEGGAVGLVRRDPNGTIDMGPMQINSLWLPRLRPEGYGVRTLVWNGCANVLAGAWILARDWWKADREGSGAIWDAVGIYHSSDPSLAAHYEWEIYRRILRGETSLRAVVEEADRTLEGDTRP